VGFGFVHNAFGDDMIGVFLEPGFTARELPQMAFGRLATTLLKTLTQRVQTLAVFLNLLTAEGFTLAIGSQVDDAQVNAKRSSHFVRSWCRDFKSHRQIEDALTIEKISLPLDGIHTRLLVSSNTEGNKNSSLKRQEGDMRQSLKGHHTRVIDNRPFWLERGLDALVTLIGFTGLADTANSQLSRKLEGSAQLTIDQLLQCKLIGGLRSPGNRSHVVRCCIELVHGVKQSVGLFFSWDKLQEHRLFHSMMIPLLRDSVNTILRHGLKPKTSYRQGLNPT